MMMSCVMTMRWCIVGGGEQGGIEAAALPAAEGQSPASHTHMVAAPPRTPLPSYQPFASMRSLVHIGKPHPSFF